MNIENETRSVYTFSPGPCSLPLDVTRNCQESLWNHNKLGFGSLEVANGSFEYQEIVNGCKANLRKLFELPSTYDVLLMEGGAHLLNSGVPLNILKEGEAANYLVTGFWGARTHKEAKKFGDINLVHPILPLMDEIPEESTWKINPNGKYFHFTDNETLSGLEFKSAPNVQGQTLVADMTSSLGTKRIAIEKYGVIYAAAQKNLGVAGSTVAFIRKDLIKQPQRFTPSYMDWRNLVKPVDSAPAAYVTHATNVYLEYLNSAPTGIDYWERLANEKADMIWDVIDGSRGFFKPICVKKEQRSRLNITFKCANDEGFDTQFLDEAAKNGLIELKGHPATKGVRASLYNGTQVEGVKKLRDFMLEFEQKNESRRDVINTIPKL